MEAEPTFTTQELAERVDGTIIGRGDLVVRGVNAMHDADVDEITFIVDQRRATDWTSSNAGAAVVTRGVTLDAGENRCLIEVADAEVALITLLETFAPTPEAVTPGIHESAVVDPTAEIAPTAWIGPHVTVGARSRVGQGVRLHPGVRLYHDVVIGDGTEIHANTVIRERVQIGRGVILHAGVMIGADGFGYRPAPDGSGLLKMPHLGGVRIEDGVEIGSCSCVDRGKFGDTVIGMGSKLDNFVQIAHNCRIGRCCVIAGCAGIGGSTIVGDGVMVGGGAAVIDGLEIGAGAQIGAASLVTKSVAMGQRVAGHPAAEEQKILRQWAAVRKLPGLVSRLSRQASSAGRS